MRTTVDLDPHLLKRLRAEAHRRGVSFKELLNGVLLRGLRAPPLSSKPYRCPSFAMGPPRRQLEKALALADLLEAEEVARELSLRR